MKAIRGTYKKISLTEADVEQMIRKGLEIGNEPIIFSDDYEFKFNNFDGELSTEINIFYGGEEV